MLDESRRQQGPQHAYPDDGLVNDLPPNQDVVAEHTIRRTVRRNYSRTPEPATHVLPRDSGRSLTICACAVAGVALAVACVIGALFLTYKSSAASQISQLQQSLAAAQSNTASNTNSVDGMGRQISSLRASIAGVLPLSQYAGYCTQDYTTSSGPAVFYIPCTEEKP